MHILHLAGKASIRRRPVNSALDRRARRHPNGPATSNEGAQMQQPSGCPCASKHRCRAHRYPQRLPLQATVGPQRFELGGAVCAAIRNPVSQGRFAPPCCAGHSVPGSRRLEAAHLKHRWSHSTFTLSANTASPNYSFSSSPSTTCPVYLPLSRAGGTRQSWPQPRRTDCGLTGRSTGAPTAGHLAREALPAYPAPRGQGVHPLSPG